MTAAYLRVSTAGQADSGLGLDAQRAKLDALATLHDLTLDAVHVDAGASAASIDGRPELARLLDGVRAGQVSTVLVSSLDRLTRSVADLDALIKLFERQGVRLISASESLDTSTACGRLMMGLTSLISQWERERIGERTRDALQAKRAQGLRSGTLPYGQRADEDGRLHVDADEQRTIDAARSLRDAGGSLRAIAASLNDRGMRTRRGGRWSAEGVRVSLLQVQRRRARRSRPAA